MENNDSVKIKKIELPVDTYLADILKAVKENSTVILTAPPGSGKTTRVPAALIENQSKIVVLVPKRIAAVSAANRIADENEFDLGTEVGYQVRFENRSNSSTKLIFMTYGLFAKRIADDSLWKNLSLVIFDEFHERSALGDVILGVCFERQVLESKLKLMVMSATLQVNELQNFFGSSRHIQIEIAPFPLQIIKSSTSQKIVCNDSFIAEVIKTVDTALSVAKKDILIFMPGLSEMRRLEQALVRSGKKLKIGILHSSTSLSEQQELMRPSSEQRIILSTNIAESSLTLPDVDCVIDSGLEKKPIRETKIGFSRLEVVRISRFSARQRAGRAARVGPGFCFQMWHELDERSMNTEILPEILKSDLNDEALLLYNSGYSNLDQFSWITKPEVKFEAVRARLRNWELIDEKNNVTRKGKAVQSLPLSIDYALLFYELDSRSFGHEAADLLAFLESADFSRLNFSINLTELPLENAGKKIRDQLLSLIRNQTSRRSNAGDFVNELVKIFFRFFPEKVAKRKPGVSGLSTQGRGIELPAYFSQDKSEYILLLSGYELSNSITFIDFAIGFSEKLFEAHSKLSTELKIEVHYDQESRRLFKIEVRKIGIFDISPPVKSFLTDTETKNEFPKYLNDKIENFLNQHPAFEEFDAKIKFLKTKKSVLGLNDRDFEFFASVNSQVLDSLSGSIDSPSDFFELNLNSILEYLAPEKIRKLVQQLPTSYVLPAGKSIRINYSGSQAPLLSARIQEFYGLAEHPKLLGGLLPLTIELLAPNYRPAQITGNLENFWSNSYFEIRKELKGRYPKHAWPDNPRNYKWEEKKRK